MDYNNQYDNGQMNNYNESYNYNQPQYNDKGNFIFAILGFFFPLIGLILYFVWKKDRPGDSKKAGTGALVCIILNIALTIIAVIIYLASWGSVQNSLVDQTCRTYGEEFVGVKDGDKWYCKDPVTGIQIEID